MAERMCGGEGFDGRGSEERDRREEEATTATNSKHGGVRFCLMEIIPRRQASVPSKQTPPAPPSSGDVNRRKCRDRVKKESPRGGGVFYSNGKLPPPPAPLPRFLARFRRRRLALGQPAPVPVVRARDGSISSLRPGREQKAKAPLQSKLGAPLDFAGGRKAGPLKERKFSSSPSSLSFSFVGVAEGAVRIHPSVAFVQACGRTEGPEGRLRAGPTKRMSDGANDPFKARKTPKEGKGSDRKASIFVLTETATARSRQTLPGVWMALISLLSLCGSTSSPPPWSPSPSGLSSAG